MELQVGVKAFLRNSKGRYLFLRRSPKKYPEVGAKWDIVGGRINPGSPLLENLKREIKEETGLELRDEPRLIAAQDILRPPEKHVVRLTYTALIEGEPRLDGDHSEYRWFTVAELKTMPEVELDRYARELVLQGRVQ